MKALLFLVIHMCHTVKAHEGVGRLAKLAVRPRRFTTHKKTMILNINIKLQKILIF